MDVVAKANIVRENVNFKLKNDVLIKDILGWQNWNKHGAVFKKYKPVKTKKYVCSQKYYIRYIDSHKAYISNLLAIIFTSQYYERNYLMLPDVIMLSGFISFDYVTYDGTYYYLPVDLGKNIESLDYFVYKQ